MRIVFRMEIYRDGAWQDFGYWKAEDTEQARQRIRRETKAEEPVRAGSAYVNPRQEQWHK